MSDTVAIIPTAMEKPAAIRRLSSALFRKQTPFVSLIFVILVLFAACFGSSVAPYAPSDADFRAILLPPVWESSGEWAYLLGTDHLGRDVLSRLIVGAQVSLLVAGTAILIAGTFGALLGLAAGYAGGAIDAIISRIVDAFLALPFILMALALVAALGAGISNIIMVMIITNWARYARVVRSEVLSIKHRDFVTLARIAGVPPAQIAIKHVLPNAMNSIFVLALLDVGRAIILESSLSFLGLGIQPPAVSWGLMLADGKAYMSFAWWVTTLPGLAIVATVMSFNSLGEWLKRRFDPRMEL